MARNSIVQVQQTDINVLTGTFHTVDSLNVFTVAQVPVRFLDQWEHSIRMPLFQTLRFLCLLYLFVVDFQIRDRMVVQ